MRMGVHLPQFREPVPGEIVAAAARAAEEAGADDVWVSDHLLLRPGARRRPRPSTIRSPSSPGRRRRRAAPASGRA